MTAPKPPPLSPEREADIRTRISGHSPFAARAAIDELLREIDRQRLVLSEGTGNPWAETAAEFARNADFYHGIVTQVGGLFGVAARTSDDGSVQDGALALKVPELVAAALAELAERKRVGDAMAYYIGDDSAGTGGCVEEWRSLTSPITADPVREFLAHPAFEYLERDRSMSPNWCAAYGTDVMRSNGYGDTPETACAAALAALSAEAPTKPKGEPDGE